MAFLRQTFSIDIVAASQFGVHWSLVAAAYTLRGLRNVRTAHRFHGARPHIPTQVLGNANLVFPSLPVCFC